MKQRPTYCEDWSCPARVSCAHHFGRSSAYWSMRQGGYDLAKYPRDPSKDSCAIYKYDRVKLFLLRDEMKVRT